VVYGQDFRMKPNTESAFARFLRTGSPEDAKADLDELEAHHAAHRARMAQMTVGTTVGSDSVDRVAAAIHAQAAAIAALTLEVQALRQPHTRTGTVTLPNGQPLSVHVSHISHDHAVAARAVEGVIDALTPAASRS